MIRNDELCSSLRTIVRRVFFLASVQMSHRTVGSKICVVYGRCDEADVLTYVEKRYKSNRVCLLYVKRDNEERLYREFHRFAQNILVAPTARDSSAAVTTIVLEDPPLKTKQFVLLDDFQSVSQLQAELVLMDFKFMD